MYKLYLFKTDGHKAEYEYKSKPTFDDMYSKIGCSMIEMSTAKMPEYSNRKDGYTDIYFECLALIKLAWYLLICKLWAKQEKEIEKTKTNKMKYFILYNH